MKLLPASRGKEPANRAEAWGCLTANLALPGAGSLAAGRPVGYYQLALATVGFVVSVASGIHMLKWMMGNWTTINQSSGDPVEALTTMWREIRWPLAGLGIFAASLLWAAITGLEILSAHPKNPVPPRIG
ncbi:MAG: hypothetical protein ABSA83_11430 [Verrucomicrobiota bacterium]|jgi:hypothetical protein